MDRGDREPAECESFVFTGVNDSELETSATVEELALLTRNDRANVVWSLI